MLGIIAEKHASHIDRSRSQGSGLTQDRPEYHSLSRAWTRAVAPRRRRRVRTREGATEANKYVKKLVMRDTKFRGI